MADGQFDHDQPLLSVDPLVCFFYSSGASTMKPKLIPYYDSALSRAASYIAHQGSKAIFQRKTIGIGLCPSCGLMLVM
ncbi:conserved hypothetical protein [Ricinus communis]|uniref:Uncharacterized protein n=1 Tax=Ricinus communis TaxID=3988 RepID=B9SFL4_RICCO|nr:conserved hypothetical protein [Ricinus communis]